jgi:hypothetical protein
MKEKCGKIGCGQSPSIMGNKKNKPIDKNKPIIPLNCKQILFCRLLLSGRFSFLPVGLVRELL